MINDYIQYLLGTMLPDFFLVLDSFLIVDGVSILGLIVAVTLLCYFIGSILMRV